MQKLLLTFLSMGPMFLYAQCMEKPWAAEEQGDPTVRMTNDMVRGKDFSGDYLSKGFKIGGGIYGGILSSGIGKLPEGNREGTLQYTSERWNQEKPAVFVEVAYQLSRSRNLAFGLSFTWSSLIKEKQWHTAVPSASESSGEALYPLRWSAGRRMNTNTFIAFTDISLLRRQTNLQLFIRPEIGISNYHTSIVFRTKDSCDCEKFISGIYDSKTRLTTGMGIGAAWEYSMIEVKALAGYRLYNSSGLVSQEHFGSWEAGLDPGSYDFKGNPSASSFVVTKPPYTQLTGYRNGVLYLQLGIYLNIGNINR